MAALWIFVVFLLHSVLPRKSNAGYEDDDPSDVYVSLNGHDFKSCGQVGSPCRTIEWAIRQIAQNGRIYLDGSGTEQQPFRCKNINTTDYAQGDQGNNLECKKSVSIQGFRQRPHVSCAKGIQFEKSNAKGGNTTVSLSGITFKETPLTFVDCDRVHFFNCSFKGSPTALSISIQNNTSVSIDIEGSSIFQNNSRCVEITLANQERFLELNINNALFKENGFLENTSLSYVISITEGIRNPKSVSQVKIFCVNVTSFGNKGSFLKMNDLSANTDELYENVQMVNNFVARENIKKLRFTQSMYFSRTRRARVRFIKLSCVKNGWGQSVRCLEIDSQQAEVSIVNSSFCKHFVRRNKGGAVLLKTNTGVFLELLNTQFSHIGAAVGGAVFVDNKKGAVRLNFSNINFTSCKAEEHASVISIGEGKHQANYSIFGEFRMIFVQKCSVSYGRRLMSSMSFIMKGGNLTLKQSKFLGNKRSGLLFVGNTGGKANVNISDTIFQNNQVNNRGKAVIRMAALTRNAGNVTLTNVLMVNNRKQAILLSPKYRIKLNNVTVTQSKSAFVVVNSWHSPKVFPVNLLVQNSTFIENIHDLIVNLDYPTSINVRIFNTKFTGSNQLKYRNNSYAIRFVIPPRANLSIGNTDIDLDNVIFDSRPSSSFALLFKGKKTLRIRRSMFRNCISFRRDVWNSKNSIKYVTESCTGAVTIINIPDRLNSSWCPPNNSRPTHREWNYDSHVIVQDTLFTRNAGCIVGAVYLSNGNVTFQNCTFQDNFAVKYAGQVYSAFGTGLVIFQNCSFLRTKEKMNINGTTFTKATVLYAESEGPILFQNTTLSSAVGERNFASVLEINNAGYVEFDQNSTIQCSVGSRLWLENNTHFRGSRDVKTEMYCPVLVTALKYSCKLCEHGFYSLDRGSSRGLVVENNYLCLKCPYGATCAENNIAARPSFWGFPDSKSPESLVFVPCPEGYCRAPSSKSLLYNKCQGNRTGVLCGECAKGFSETIFSSECRRELDCGSSWLWIATIIFSIALALFLLKKELIARFLRCQILWFKQNTETPVVEDPSQVDEKTDSGYLKITFYFYQVADLVTVESLQNFLKKFPFINFVVDAFNLQIRIVNQGIGCPFAGLTVVTKELLLSLIVPVTITSVGVIYVIHLTISMIRRKRKKPPIIHYMATVLEILLLGYERLAETALMFMHCVPIGSENRLFLDGNIKCWQWWQFVLLAFIAVFIVPFIAVLYLGSFKLYSASLSARGFLGACVFPLPFLVYWLAQHLLNRTSQEESIIRSAQHDDDDILEILHGPFRPPNDKDYGTLYWESVLIGRRFVLLVCHAFVADPMLRMILITGACVLMLVHHETKNPYRDPFANKLESLSLTTLSLMAVINLARATLESAGVSPMGPIKRYLDGLQWFELFVLGVFPALLCVLIVFAILSQLVRLAIFIVVHLHMGLCLSPTLLQGTSELQRPLLDGYQPTYGDLSSSNPLSG